jgi:hypothetical protein
MAEMLTSPSCRLVGGALLLALLTLVLTRAAEGQVGASAAEPFVRATLRLSEREAANLAQGRAIAKTFPASLKREVTTGGAIRIEGSSTRFVEQYRTLEGFRRSSFVLQIARFSDPPQLSDLDPLTLEPNDIKALRTCEVGECDIRLSGEDIKRVNTEVDWRAPDADQQAVLLFKRLLLEHLAEYRAGGIDRLIHYEDDEPYVRLADETKALLEQEPSPLDAAPALRTHLLSFPLGIPPLTEHFFYWSKEAFGFQPVVGLNHVTVHTTSTNRVLIVTTQIYASHYMDGQTAVTALLPVEGATEQFYWLYFNRARIDRLGGMLGTISRPIVQRRARSGLARTLADTKTRIEAQD